MILTYTKKDYGICAVKNKKIKLMEEHSMNKVILMGRLVRDPDVRYSQNGTDSMAIARYTLAVDRRRSSRDNEQSADFISCVAFGKAGEFAEKYLHQGIKIAIIGRIQTGSYTNKEGHKVYTTDVVVEEQEFTESKANNQTPVNNTSSGSSDGFMNIPDGVDDEGLPFN